MSITGTLQEVSNRVQMRRCRILHIGHKDRHRLVLWILPLRRNVNRINYAEIGWLAGIIDGEGCIWVSKKPSRGTKNLEIRVAMADFDVVTNLQKVTGVGTLSIVKKQSHGHKDLLLWRVSNVRDCLDILATIATVEQMSNRKREKISEAMDVISDSLARKKAGWSRRSTIALM